MRKMFDASSGCPSAMALRACIRFAALSLFWPFIAATAGLADTVTTYQLSSVTFTSGNNTWDVTGGFTYDDFDNGGGGTESNVLFTITGPSIAFTGTYTQILPVAISGNGFYALGTRTDGSPSGSPYDVTIVLDSPSQVGNPHIALVNLFTFTVPGFGNFAGFENVTGEVIPSQAATPLPAALPLFAGGLGALGLFGWRRRRKNTALVTA